MISKSQATDNSGRKKPVPGAGAPSNSVFVARQPIFNSNGQVFGYELLYRSRDMDTAAFNNGSVATAELVINSFIEFDIREITNGKQAFINLTREYITGELPIPLEPENVVLEVLEDISADQESIDGAKALVEKGFTLALDDFILDDNNEGFMPFAQIIKIDLMAMSSEELVAEVEKLKKFPVKLLAEKVETREEYEHCLKLGFDYFQGYFFSKPTILEGKQLQANQLSLLEIISKLQADPCDIDEIEEIILKDVGISYKLLKIINSSYYSLSKKVESIQHALMLLGLDALRNWVTLICFSMVENKPDELIAMSLIRARLCASLAKIFGCNTSSAFTVGLFSMLDVLMDRPLEELLGNVPLAEDIKAALCSRDGKLGKLLIAVEGYEKCDWSMLSDYDLGSFDLNHVYLDALAEANKLTGMNV